jgi:hypothetical protein
MVRSIEGIYHNGKVELLESPPSASKARVIVTFLPAPTAATVRRKKMGLRQAADLRARLKTFQQDWDRPEMDAYDAL